MFSYPNDLPLLEIKNVISIIRNKEVDAKKVELAHDAWVIQGYAQGRFLGDPGISLINSNNSDSDPIAEMEKIIANLDGASIQYVIDWSSIMKWVMQILLEQILK